MTDDLTKKVSKAIKENVNKSSKLKKKPTNKLMMNINGNGNIQAGGDVSINSKKIERVLPPPRGPEHISDACAYKLSELVKKAVEIDVKTGKEKAKSYQTWWSRLKKRYKVPRYDLIPCISEEDAVSYMQQEIAKLRPKLRRKDNDAWRKEHYTGIWARSKQLGYDKAWVYSLVEEKIGKKIKSLTELGEQDLKRLYIIIMGK